MYNLIKTGFVLITAIFCLSCNTRKPDMRAVELINHWEFSINGKLEQFHNIIFLIYSKEYMILKEPYGFESSHSNGKIPPEGYRYLILKAGDRYGLAFSSPMAESGRKYPVDSLINNYLSTPGNFYNIKITNPDSVQVIRNKANRLTLEKITNSKTNETDQDSCYFYYQDKKIALPFYNKSARLRTKYLYKSRIIFNEHKKGGYSPDYPVLRRELLFEIKECKVPEQAQLLLLLERFKKQTQL